MAKIHKYDMSRRLDNGKWEVVGKVYKDSKSGRLTAWIEPAKMAKIIKGQKEGVPFILFDKEPEPSVYSGQNQPEIQVKPLPDPKVNKPQQAPPVYLDPGAQRTAQFVPKPTMTPPIVAKASDNWPPDFDDKIPF